VEGVEEAEEEEEEELEEDHRVPLMPMFLNSPPSRLKM